VIHELRPNEKRGKRMISPGSRIFEKAQKIINLLQAFKDVDKDKDIRKRYGVL
jgi:hypothetical protein